MVRVIRVIGHLLIFQSETMVIQAIRRENTRPYILPTQKIFQQWKEYLTTELQSSDEKAVFSAAGTLTTPYTLRMQMTWLPAEVETGGSYEFPQTFYVDGRFYTAEKLEFFLSA